MNPLKIAVFLLVIVVSSTLMSQNAKAQINKASNKAKIELINGQNRLVLVTGIHATESSGRGRYPDNIELAIDDNLWRQLDSVLASPMGSRFKTKDVNGFIVEVVHGNINSNSGLMFTSGSKFVSITKKDYIDLR